MAGKAPRSARELRERARAAKLEKEGFDPDDAAAVAAAEDEEAQAEATERLIDEVVERRTGKPASEASEAVRERAVRNEQLDQSGALERIRQGSRPPAGQDAEDEDDDDIRRDVDAAAFDDLVAGELGKPPESVTAADRQRFVAEVERQRIEAETGVPVSQLKPDQLAAARQRLRNEDLDARTRVRDATRTPPTGPSDDAPPATTPPGAPPAGDTTGSGTPADANDAPAPADEAGPGPEGPAVDPARPPAGAPGAPPTGGGATPPAAPPAAPATPAADAAPPGATPGGDDPAPTPDAPPVPGADAGAEPEPTFEEVTVDRGTPTGEQADVEFAVTIFPAGGGEEDNGAEFLRSSDGRWFDEGGHEVTDPGLIETLDSAEAGQRDAGAESVPPGTRTVEVASETHEEAAAAAQAEAEDDDEDEDEDDGDGDGDGDEGEGEGDDDDDEGEGGEGDDDGEEGSAGDQEEATGSTPAPDGEGTRRPPPGTDLSGADVDGPGPDDGEIQETEEGGFVAPVAGTPIPGGPIVSNPGELGGGRRVGPITGVPRRGGDIDPNRDDTGAPTTAGRELDPFDRGPGRAPAPQREAAEAADDDDDDDTAFGSGRVISVGDLRVPPAVLASFDDRPDFTFEDLDVADAALATTVTTSDDEDDDGSAPDDDDEDAGD